MICVLDKNKAGLHKTYSFVSVFGLCALENIMSFKNTGTLT